jgi:hydrogenase large subunit
MSKRIVVDPITRIEGHLRIDVEVDGGKVTKAWSSGQMFRGIENILQGRDPREAWLFTQRFCGVCTTVHAIASVRAVENAVGVEVPLNAQLIRNLILAAHAMHDHIVHFFHLSALDWVDVVSALDADPKATAKLAQSLSPWPRNSVQELTAVKDKLAGFVARGQLGPFANGYWGHSAMKLPPEVNLLAVSHYLQALDYQRTANKVVAILGGKTPNIQNLAVGGVANAINLDNQSTINMNTLFTIKNLLDEMHDFVKHVYLTDVCAIGALYPDWLGYGSGVVNYLAVPDLPLDSAGTKFDLPGGTIMNGDLGTFKPITNFKDKYFADNVVEGIAHSWYQGDWERHPYEEDTVPNYAEYDENGMYSWIKSPRFKGEVMQVGPLAQVLVGAVSGHEPTARWLKFATDLAGSVAGIPIKVEMLHSTLGRHLGRAVRCAVICELAQNHWKMLVDNIASGDTDTFNEPVFSGLQSGFGFHEAPRGTLAHFVVIENGKIKNYQAVVPSTWNAGPRDAKNRPGPYEASLVGNPIADPERPLEVLRTIHSFDPCIACAVHTLDVEGNEIGSVRTL